MQEQSVSMELLQLLRMVGSCVLLLLLLLLLLPAAANTNKTIGSDAKHAMEIWTMERPIHLGASKALQNVSSSLSAVVENGMVTDQDASFC